MGTADIKATWIRKWNRWNSSAQPVLERNADECAGQDGLDKMACIAEKNRTTVTKRALGISVE